MYCTQCIPSAEELRGLRGEVSAVGAAALGAARPRLHLRAVPPLAHRAEAGVRRHADAATTDHGPPHRLCRGQVLCGQLQGAGRGLRGLRD